MPLPTILDAIKAGAAACPHAVMQFRIREVADDLARQFKQSAKAIC